MSAAVAYANNDVAHITWKYDRKIKDCLGYAVFRIDAESGERTTLPSWVGFKNHPASSDVGVWFGEE